MKIFKMILALMVFSSTAFSNDTWFSLAPDLDVKEISIKSHPIFGSNLLFIRTKLKDYQVKVIRAQEYGEKRLDIKQLALKSNAVLAINANFFDENGKALGLVINRGRVFNRLHAGGKTLTGIFQATRKNIKISGRNNIEYHSILEAVQAGPRLLINGLIPETKNSFQNSKRSGICIDKKGRLIIFVTTETFSGITLDILQKVLVSSEIECVNALNFDGGGSSQFFISNKIPNLNGRIESRYIPGNDKIPVAVGLFAKTQANDNLEEGSFDD